MYTARCTPRVLEALHLSEAENDLIPSTALGDWYVDFIQTRKHRLVHFVSDRSLLSIVVPVRTLKTALARHVPSLRDLLAAMGVNQRMIDLEVAEMEQQAVAHAQSEMLLAPMRDLALHARHLLEGTPDMSLAQVSWELSQVPCARLDMRVPAEAAIALLVGRHVARSEDMLGA